LNTAVTLYLLNLLLVYPQTFAYAADIRNHKARRLKRWFVSEVFEIYQV